MYRLLGRVTMAALGCLALGASVVGCDDETQDRAEEAVESAQEDVEGAANDAQARAAAEQFRADVRAQETDDDAGGVRQVDVLTQAAENLPGDPEVTGIADTDGDGADDDGLVEITVGEGSACVELPESGNEIDVSGGRCSG